MYLFCLAMDPLFTYLNRIPGVISVQGYIDDTTIAGNSQCLSWLEEVAHTYECLKSAGFVVDAHSCFRACVTIQNRRRPGTMNSNEIENVWPGLISSEPYSTALAALQAHNRPGYNTVIVRIGSDAALPGEQDRWHLAPARFVFSHTNKSRTSNLGEKCTNLVPLLR